MDVTETFVERGLIVLGFCAFRPSNNTAEESRWGADLHDPNGTDIAMHVHVYAYASREIPPMCFPSDVS